MYHELTKKQKRKRLRKRLLGLVIIVVLAVGIFVVADQVDRQLREQGEVAVRNAILDGAKQCCAIEGAYPTSVSYLEENYGLVINHADYTVTYEVFAENVMPSVVVLAK